MLFPFLIFAVFIFYCRGEDEVRNSMSGVSERLRMWRCVTKRAQHEKCLSVICGVSYKRRIFATSFSQSSQKYETT